MISSLLALDYNQVLQLIITSAISVILYIQIMNFVFKDNIIFLFKKLFAVREAQPVLYSYRHISLMIVSYFLIIISLLSLNLFYLILEIYTYYGVELNIAAIEYSELSIKIVTILCATLNVISIVLYYIRNNENFMKLLHNNYCLIESFLSILLCTMYVAAVKYSNPTGKVGGDFSSFLIVIALCFVILDIFLQKLQSKKKKDSLRKILFGNSKIKDLTNLSRNGDISLLYNILICNSLTIILIFYTNILGNITLAKAISYILLELVYIGVTKRYKAAINNIIQIKETN